MAWNGIGELSALPSTPFRCRSKRMACRWSANSKQTVMLSRWARAVDGRVPKRIRRENHGSGPRPVHSPSHIQKDVVHSVGQWVGIRKPERCPSCQPSLDCFDRRPG